TTASATASITAKGLSVSGVTATNKTYDRTTNASLSFGSASLVGVITPDVVTVDSSAATGAFSTKDVGASKPVTVTGVALSGADSGNYSLTQPTTTANVTAKALTVSGLTASNKTYDGSTTAVVSAASAVLVGSISGDAVSIGVGSLGGSFADKSVATGKVVT